MHKTKWTAQPVPMKEPSVEPPPRPRTLPGPQKPPLTSASPPLKYTTPTLMILMSLLVSLVIIWARVLKQHSPISSSSEVYVNGMVHKSFCRVWFIVISIHMWDSCTLLWAGGFGSFLLLGTMPLWKYSRTYPFSCWWIFWLVSVFDLLIHTNYLPFFTVLLRYS